MFGADHQKHTDERFSRLEALIGQVRIEAGISREASWIICEYLKVTREKLTRMENAMSALTDAVTALINERNAERANAAMADGLAAQVVQLTGERDAALKDAADAMALIEAAKLPAA